MQWRESSSTSQTGPTISAGFNCSLTLAETHYKDRIGDWSASRPKAHPTRDQYATRNSGTIWNEAMRNHSALLDSDEHIFHVIRETVLPALHGSSGCRIAGSAMFNSGDSMLFEKLHFTLPFDQKQNPVVCIRPFCNTRGSHASLQKTLTTRLGHARLADDIAAYQAGL